MIWDCRLCGRSVQEPREVRLLRPRGAGFRCERCGNTFCSEHAVRINGLLESITVGARFSCPLCLSEASEDASG